MAIVTCLVGLHYGHIISHFKDHRNRVLHWTISSTSLVVLGLALDLFGKGSVQKFLVYNSNSRSCCVLFLTKISAFIFSGMHINKALYTFSYMCMTAGSAGIIFAGIYLMVGIFLVL